MPEPIGTDSEAERSQLWERQTLRLVVEDAGNAGDSISIIALSQFSVTFGAETEVAQERGRTFVRSTETELDSNQQISASASSSGDE